MTIHLREYQQQALDAEAKHRAEHPDETRLAIVLPTGTGKGTIIAERAVRFIEDPMSSGLRALVIVHTDELVADLAARCRLRAADSEFPIRVGIVKAGQDETDADIIVASRQTLERPERRARITDVGLVIVDEIHIGPSAYGSIMRHFGCFPCETCKGTGWDSTKHFDDVIAESHQCGYCCAMPPTPALGFTATMERSDGAGLGNVWQDVVFTRDVSWAVRKGYLVQPVGYRLEIDVSATQYPEEPLRFSQAPSVQDRQIADGIAPEKIVEKWRELASDRQTIVFAPLVRSAKRIMEAFDEAGVSSAAIWGDMMPAARRAVVEEFKAGQIQVLCNAMVLTAGFDHPGIGCVVVARPTKSRTLFVQMAGRGLRPVPGVPVEEQDCILISLADDTSDLCSHVDLSDRPLDRKAQGALTAMEDAWDLGAELADETRLWTGQVDARQFDPLVTRSSKVWRATKHGTPFLPISKEGEYIFIVGTSVFVRENLVGTRVRIQRLHSDLPDLELAMQVAEDEAQERGGDLGRLLADRARAWRKQVPSQEMLGRAYQLGLRAEVDKIMSARAGGKAGKVSDLISKVIATRALEPMVERIKEATK